MEKSNITFPLTFKMKPNCSQCKKMVKSVFSTMIRSTVLPPSRYVEGEGEARVKVTVTSTISPDVFAAIIGQTAKENLHNKDKTRASNAMQEENNNNNTDLSYGQNIFKGHRVEGTINLQELVKTNKMKQFELVQNLRIKFNHEKKDDGNEASQKGIPPPPPPEPQEVPDPIDPPSVPSSSSECNYQLPTAKTTNVSSSSKCIIM